MQRKVCGHFFRRKLFIAFSFFSICFHSENSRSELIEIAEDKSEQEVRLKRLSNTFAKYKVNPDEKFVYLGGANEEYLTTKSILYRNYNSSNTDSYIYVIMNYGNSAEYNLQPSTVKLLSQIKIDDYTGRINNYILEKDNSRIQKYYGEKYDEYYQQKVTFVKKIIDSGTCDTVTNADLYSFGRTYFNAVCGDRMEVSQTIEDLKQGKPLDKTIKKMYVTISKEAKAQLRTGKSTVVPLNK